MGIQSVGDYLELAVIHHQFRITVPAGDSYATLPNPFVGFLTLPDADNLPAGTITWFPSKSLVFERDPGIEFDQVNEVGRGFLAGVSAPGHTPDLPYRDVDWPVDVEFAAIFLDIQTPVTANLTVWMPYKDAKKYFYTRTAVEFP